ncbi:MAG: PD40 domain-containing protein, partial [Cytophagaceae bacterium]|nr:PD40 domain-containing protein [Gemmatimonadaceae bacterium]
LYFSSNRDGSWDVYRVRQDGTGWSAPQKLPEGINTAADEWPGSVEAEGRFLLFSSIRAGGAGADDIYIACASGDGWRAPVMLGDSINTAAFEDTPLITPDGRYLLFGRHGGGHPAGPAGALHRRSADVVNRACD